MHCSLFHRQPCWRAHCSTARWPPRAAELHVPLPQVQPCCRANCSTSRWPPRAAELHVPLPQSQPCWRAHCSAARWPPAAARQHTAGFRLLSAYPPSQSMYYLWLFVRFLLELLDSLYLGTRGRLFSMSVLCVLCSRKTFGVGASMPGTHTSSRGSTMGGQGPGALRTTAGRHSTAKQRPQIPTYSAWTSGRAVMKVGMASNPHEPLRKCVCVGGKRSFGGAHRAAFVRPKRAGSELVDFLPLWAGGRAGCPTGARIGISGLAFSRK